MKTILASALALGVMTSAAFAGPVKVTPAQAGPVKVTPAQAEPVKLTAAQMDSVTAGQFTFQSNAVVQAILAASVFGNATVAQDIDQSNEID